VAMKLHLFVSWITILFSIFQLDAVQYDASAVYAVDCNISAHKDHHYRQKRMGNKKNFKDLLEVAKILSMVKDAGSEAVSAPSKYDVPEYPESDNNVFETPQYWFSYAGRQRQDQNEKKALVTGFIAFLHILVKKEFCLKEEEKRRYDLFCKSFTVNDLVNHVDSLFKNPLYRDEGAQWLIYEYMTYNFQNYIGDPIMLPG
jgi:hypothetical protein